MSSHTLTTLFLLTLTVVGLIAYTALGEERWEYALLEHHKSSGAEPRTNIAHWVTRDTTIEVSDESLYALLEQVTAHEAPGCETQEGNLVTYLECLGSVGWELLDYSHKERTEALPWPLQSRTIETDKYTFKRTHR